MTKTLDDFFDDNNQNEIEKCDECGTTENLTVYFGMNEQTGKYNFHLCATCAKSNDEKQNAQTAKRNEITNRNITIAETDN